MKDPSFRLYDVHCHLQDERIGDDLVAVLARAADTGVQRMMCCGIEPGDWQSVIEMAACHPQVRPSVGLHPWYLEKRTGDWRERLEELVAGQRCGVGEIGLDHHLPSETRPLQLEIFRFQVRLANRYGRPVSIHCRRAWQPLLEELKAQGGLAAGGMVHAYGGAPGIVAALERRNLSISFGGGITRPNARRPLEACRAVSADRLLVETDSPDILPTGCPGPHNEPACMIEVIKAVALIRGLDVETAADLTWTNARRLYADLESPAEN